MLGMNKVAFVRNKINEAKERGVRLYVVYTIFVNSDKELVYDVYRMESREVFEANKSKIIRAYNYKKVYEVSDGDTVYGFYIGENDATLNFKAYYV